MMTMLMWLLLYFTVYEPCPVCKAKGWYEEYRIIFIQSEPRIVTCPKCNGTGWNTRRK